MKILIYSFNDKIGDGLQKITFLQKLKEIYPQSKITYTTTNTTTLKNLLNPFVEDIIDDFIENNNIKSSFLDLFKRNLLFSEHFDLIIDLQKVVLRTLNLKKINHSNFFSATANFSFSNYKNDLELSFKNIYIERFYFNILSILQNQVIEDIPNIKIPYRDVSAAKIADSSNLNIGIAPGAGSITRQWNFEKYLLIGQKLRDQGYNIYFFLGPNEKNLLQRCYSHNFICPEWSGDRMISNDLLFTMNLAKKMDCLICNDGGTAWMFEFAGIKTFKLFGITNETKFARPGFSQTIQISDYGFTNIINFPIDIYEKELNLFIKNLRN